VRLEIYLFLSKIHRNDSDSGNTYFALIRLKSFINRKIGAKNLNNQRAILRLRWSCSVKINLDAKNLATLSLKADSQILREFMSTLYIRIEYSVEESAESG
jgi:hypothetical protein